MIPRLLGKTTRETRPDLVDGALAMMRKMSPEDVAQVQRGMAERPDSVTTLKTINVPTLVLTGDEDILTGPPEAELMHSNIAGSEMKIVPRAGHFSPWEQPEQGGKILRQFLDSLAYSRLSCVCYNSLVMVDMFLVPPKTVVDARGDSAAVEVSG